MALTDPEKVALIVGQSTHRGPRWPNLLPTARLCFGFFLVLTAYFTAESLLPLVLKQEGEGNLGFYSFTVAYVTFALSCAPARVVLKKFCPRQALPLTASVYSVYVGVASLAANEALNANGTAAILMCSSAFIGISSSIMWCALGHILTYYAPPKLLNCYVSAFFALYAVNGLVGPLLVRFLLTYMDMSQAYGVLCAVGFIGVYCLHGLPDPDPEGDTALEPKLQHISTETLMKEIYHEFKRPGSLVTENWRSLCIASLSFANGIAASPFVAATLSQVALARMRHASPERGRERAAISLICMGCGQLCASLIFTPLADMFGRKYALCFAFAQITFAATFCHLETTDVEEFRILPFAYIAAFTLGLANLTCRALLQALLSTLYCDEPTKGSAVQALSAATGTVLGFMILPSLSCTVASGMVVFLYASAAAACASNPSLWRKEIA